MIIHKLIAHHLKHGDDAEFYVLQAQDAIRWLQAQGVRLGGKTTALDLGCGHGIFGLALSKLGCDVTFADEADLLLPQIPKTKFRPINLDQDDPATLGKFDLVICSNVLEHLAQPEGFIGSIPAMLNPDGNLYLSWTNWLSPWGGHEFSPFHYLGAKRGHLIWDRVRQGTRKHTPFVNLFPTSIGKTLSWIEGVAGLRITKVAPRYYPELSLVTRLPVIREFLAWNCAILIGRKP